MIASVNILEGIRFYVSFACSWAFAENNLMEGNAKIIKLICRDENLHLAGTQFLLTNLPREDVDYQKIKIECEKDIIEMYKVAAEDEKEWANYLFKDDSMLGLSKKLLCQYVEYITNERLKAIDLDPIYEQDENPLPWTNTWISNQDGKNKVQVAPQESEITSYLVGQVNQDVEADSFKDFNLE